MQIDKSIKILVVEDNPGFTTLLQILLQEAGLSKIRIASSYEEGLATFLAFEPDICLLDIQLGNNQKTGIDLANTIREHDTQVPIIYLTSNYSEAYYQMSRHTKPSGFMNKELSTFKIQQALDLAIMHMEPAATTTPGTVPPVVTNQQFFFKIGDIYKSIPVKEIAYFFADQKLTYAKVGQRNYPTNVQLKTLEEEFAEHFARIHKTFLVNINLIESIHLKEDMLFIAGESLPIGYAYKKAFLSRLNLLR